jgi:hypothetical protein
MKNVRYAKQRLCVKANVVDNGEYIEVTMADLEYPMTGVKRYYHTLFRLLQLTGCDRIYLDWLTEVMGTDNSVYINDDEMLRFITSVSEMGVEYKVSTVKQAFKRLRARNLLLKTKKASGLFHVNPIFFSKGTERERLQNIRMLMEFDINDTTGYNDIKIKIFHDMQTIKK